MGLREAASTAAPVVNYFSNVLTGMIALAGVVFMKTDLIFVAPFLSRLKILKIEIYVRQRVLVVSPF